MNPLTWLGNKIALYLQKPSPTYRSETTCEPERLLKTLRKGDVLLVDGISRVSTAIKYLTQSTWSHATLCVEDQADKDNPNPSKVWLLEADVVEGVRLITIERYMQQGTRICRPIGLKDNHIDKLIHLAKEKLGHQYDTKNVIDLARYLFATPPVPAGWRRNMLTLGSGDPTRAICSSLIAQCFQSVRYPILPIKVQSQEAENAWQKRLPTLFRARHHTLFVPRDFDLSPYFAIIKPSIEQQFSPYDFDWDESDPPSLSASVATDVSSQ